MWPVPRLSDGDPEGVGDAAGTIVPAEAADEGDPQAAPGVPGRSNSPTRATTSATAQHEECAIESPGALVSVEWH